MILRGRNLSPAAVRVVVEDRRPAPRVEAPPARDVPAPVDPRPAITLERVTEWLEEQDSDVRNVLAAALATEIEDKYEAARERGWEDGCDEARARAKEKQTAHVATLERLAVELRAAFERDAAVLAEQCCEIVMECLRKIAGPVIAAPEAVAGAVAQVLERLKGGHEVLVRVRPDELDTLQAAEPVLAKAVGGAPFTLIGDQRVELGGCIVESIVGKLDGRLEVQLNELCETLRVAKAEVRKQ